MAGSEVFESAPLAMVVAEIRFSYVPALDSHATMAAVLGKLGQFVPRLESGRRETFEAQVGGESPTTTVQATNVLQARSMDGQTTAAITPETLELAMSGVAYTRYDDSLRVLLQAAYRALVEHLPDVLVTRAGLRYLDEIRVPDAQGDLAQWRRWIAPELLAAADYMSTLGGRAIGLRSTWEYSLPDDIRTLLNYGPFHGSGVIGQGHPFHKAGPESLMFVLDVDTSWMPPEGAASIGADALASRYDQLHQPAQVVFASAVTDGARRLFREGS